MKYSFNITKESFKEFKLSVSSDPEYKLLDRLKKQVEKRFEEGDIDLYVLVPVKIGSEVDAIFHLVNFDSKEDQVSFRFEFNGTCG